MIMERREALSEKWNDDLRLSQGSHYRMDEYDLIYVMESKSKTKRPVFLLQDAGSGRYMDGMEFVKEYQNENPMLCKFYRRWKDAILNLQLPSLKAVNAEPILKKEMCNAIREHDGKDSQFAWIRDIDVQRNGAWCMDRKGVLYVGHMEGKGIYLFLLTMRPEKITVEEEKNIRRIRTSKEGPF